MVIFVVCISEYSSLLIERQCKEEVYQVNYQNIAMLSL